MSESFVNPLFGHRVQQAPDAEVATHGTGHPEVDGVVASLAGLDELEVSDHVAVFEQAHETLRRTLAGAGQEKAQPSPTAGRS